ncbi:MAG TPA: peptidylprolyl isomerase [Acidisoma sp.]|uniref:peptidylprolyl isomerase n=1 Tax=Acidisoma sp. TaxID=1872115 RepID=UPI002BA0926A|nr:peptidylprolyl isomerase [Acidisoma sp.]HTH99690.1 peptidylprolyl isomerase [Acidisoma sp.]
MRRSCLSLTFLASTALAFSLTVQGASAQSAAAGSGQPAAAPAGTADTAPKNPVIATVNGQDIHMSDLQEMARNLPQQLQGMSPQQLYPILLDQIVDQKAMAIQAKKDGLLNDPAVQQQIEVGTEQVLQGALIRKVIGPQITPEAIKAVYDKDYADKPGVEEVHARHILVKTQKEAQDIIKQLDKDKGANFAELAKKDSTDPGSANGGDLGWFKKTDMVPEFADAAFAMKDGQITQTPVHTQFGWHVIQVLGHRTDPAPKLADVQDKIRNQLIQEGIHKLLEQVRSQVAIKEFAPDGSPLPAADAAPTGAAPAAPASK